MECQVEAGAGGHTVTRRKAGFTRHAKRNEGRVQLQLVLTGPARQAARPCWPGARVSGPVRVATQWKSKGREQLG